MRRINCLLCLALSTVAAACYADEPKTEKSNVVMAKKLEYSQDMLRALMNDDLSRVPFLVELARKTRSIIAQNVAASILIALLGLALAATGVLSQAGRAALPIAALYHFVGDVFVLANSFRLFRFGESFAASEETPQTAGMKRRAASVRGLANPQVA